MICHYLFITLNITWYYMWYLYFIYQSQIDDNKLFMLIYVLRKFPIFFNSNI